MASSVGERFNKATTRVLDAAKERPIVASVAVVAGVITVGAIVRKIFSRPTPEDPTRRPLGTAEAGMVQLSRKFRGSMRVAMRLQLQGPAIDEQDVRAAVERLQRRHPFLRSVVKETKGAGPHNMEIAEAMEVRIPVKTMPYTGDEAWREAWRVAEKVPYEFCQPIASVIVLTGGETGTDTSADQTSDVVFMVEHAFCDGKSVAVVSHELAAAIAAVRANRLHGTALAPVTSLPLMPSIETMSRDTMLDGVPFFLKSIAVIWKLIRMGLSANSAVSKEGVVESPVDKAWTARRRVEESNTVNKYVVVDGEDLVRFNQARKKRGTTVTAAVGAALMYAFADVLGSNGPPLSMICACDLRDKYVAPMENHHLSYHISGVLGYNDHCKDTSVDAKWALAKRLKVWWNNWIKSGFAVTIGLVMGATYKKMADTKLEDADKDAANNAFAFTTSISSWGKLDYDETYGDWKLMDVRPSANMSASPQVTLLLTTVHGRMTATLQGSQATPPDHMNAIAEALHAELQALAQS